jgi:hypothetical protein
LPLAVWRWTRPLIWFAMVVMHLGIMTLVSFADLSAGMLMLHFFTWDSRWPAMIQPLHRRFLQKFRRSGLEWAKAAVVTGVVRAGIKKT